MYVKSIKINKDLIQKILVGIGVALILLLGWKAFASKSAPSVATPTASDKVRYEKIRSNEDRVNFIKQFGWEVEDAAVEVMEVVIPKEFDSVYTSYNNLQQEQGLDLEKHKGKRVKRWSYRVTNYPGDTGEIRANLLILGDKIIAADICKNELDGFMHGMKSPGA